MASLTRESFDLSSDEPTVTVEAAYSKRRRRDTIVLPKEVVPLRFHRHQMMCFRIR
jgi:hypothetical protein